MIENYLLKIGMKCGTVANFSNTIVEYSKLHKPQSWYFLTPVKCTAKIGMMKEATLNLAFPFPIAKNDTSEAIVLQRLNEVLDEYETELLFQLRKFLNVPPGYQINVIPFWANEKGERNIRKDLGAGGVHIINFQGVVRYREKWFSCDC